MGRHKLIERFEDLPTTPEDRESLVLDYKSSKSEDAGKGAAAPNHRREMAKDIAAFANHVGGTLLVGAEEPTISEGPQHKGVSPEYAEKLLKEYDLATRDFCLPHPIVLPVLIDLPAGRKIVAINVEAFPDQPIGVKGEEAHSWRFPMRVGSHTTWITPDQIPLLTNAPIRRMIILLSRIPKGEPIEILYFSALQLQPPMEPNTFDLIADNNALMIEVESSPSYKIHIPLDEVRMVWKGVKKWSILIHGTISGQDYYPGRP